MDIAIVVAVIALLGAIFSSLLSVYGQLRTAKLQAEREARQVLGKYREPLILAAYDLQSRLFNILRQDFLRRYYLKDLDGSREYAREHTLYLVGQYFGWTEIMRREIQFLRFEQAGETREVARLQQRIRSVFASDAVDLGTPFMVWRGEQNAIGERMITVEDGQRLCIGYATFVERQTCAQFRRWFERLASDLDVAAREPNERLRVLQRHLVDLVIALDEGQVRFQEEIEKV